MNKREKGIREDERKGEKLNNKERCKRLEKGQRKAKWREQGNRYEKKKLQEEEEEKKKRLGNGIRVIS